ncbi:MAG: glycosyl transferase, partial [Oscillospiraceae bacterium]|nr:glycosyl transferase [Oscillospiraceae bacterium]
PPGDTALFYAAARLILKGGDDTVQSQISVAQTPALAPRRINLKQDGYGFPAVQREAGLAFDNGLGGFTADGKEYVIQPGAFRNTPAPWINVIANPRFGFTASESGSGYTWYENSHEYRLTPWANDSVSDSQGEIFYLTDTETGLSWTPTMLPVREDGPYKIRHGFGYTVYEHTSHEIEQTLTQHVPAEDTVKISTLKIKNLSPAPRTLSVTYYVRPVLGVSDRETAPHIRTVKTQTVALLAENPYNEVFPGRVCFLHTSGKEITVTGNRLEFFGEGGASAPDCLYRAELSGETGTGFDPCCALRVNMTLLPGETKETVFLFGSAENAWEAETLAEKYADASAAGQSLKRARAFWRDKLERTTVSTPDASMNLMLNGWLQYQMISCRLWARTGHYQSGGAFGFRDQLQDSLSAAAYWPELTREQILLHARHQFTGGDVQHWWHSPQGKGVRTRISDDLLWLPYVTAEYVRISGDESILLEEIPFLEAEELAETETERYGDAVTLGESATLYKHCVRAVERALKFGSRGLPLMGGGDWNDGMNAIGINGRGESVWLAWFLISVLDLMLPLCRRQGDGERLGRYAAIRDNLQEAAEKSGWDGGWYRRAYFDDGMPLGSSSSGDCRIDAIAQSWAVLSGAGDKNRARKAMDMLEEYLVSREDGLIKLLTPPFDSGTSEPGYIKGYVPGVRENGGQYTHAAVWAVMAFAKLGEGGKAAELYALINPVNHTKNQRECSKYKLEPYVMAADVYAARPHTGRGGWSWYTGAAGWMYRAGVETILGLQKNGDSLTFDPCIPREWKEYTITTHFHETTYRIVVQNFDGVQKGVARVTFDGEIVANQQVSLVNDGKTHDIRVSMGKYCVNVKN